MGSPFFLVNNPLTAHFSAKTSLNRTFGKEGLYRSVASWLIFHLQQENVFSRNIKFSEKMAYNHHPNEKCDFWCTPLANREVLEGHPIYHWTRLVELYRLVPLFFSQDLPFSHNWQSKIDFLGVFGNQTKNFNKKIFDFFRKHFSIMKSTD